MSSLRKPLKITLIIGFLLTEGILFTLILRKEIATRFLQNYLQRQRISARFQISELSWNRIVLTDVQVEKKTKASRIEIRVTSFFSGVENLRKVEAIIESIDLPEVIAIASHFSDPSSIPTATDWREPCTRLLPLELDLSVRTVSSGATLYAVDSVIRHNPGDPSLHLAMKTGELPLSEKFADRFKIDLLADARCEGEVLSLQLERFIIQSDKITLPELVGNRVDLQFPPQSLQFRGTDPQSPVHVRIHAKSLAVFAGKWNLAEPVITSEIHLLPTGLRFSNVAIQEATDQLKVKKIEIEYSWNGKIQIAAKPSSPIRFKLTDELLAFLPLSDHGIESIRGSLSVSGTATYANGKLSGPVAISSHDGSVDSAYGSFEKIHADYHVDSLIPFRPSARTQTLASKNAVLGDATYEMTLSFQTKDHSHFVFKSLRLKEHDSEILADHSFSLNLDPLTLRDFHVVLRRLPLERLLQFALKERVTAEGFVSGDLSLEYIDQKPKISGLLAGTENGRIRYSLTGQAPDKTIQLSDGPVDILNGYLYDFEYTELSVKITTDPQYQMLVHLATTGRNPDYLGRKPLKLNLKVEQNLLSALKSLMLSYNLPAQLKKLLEHSENP